MAVHLIHTSSLNRLVLLARHRHILKYVAAAHAGRSLVCCLSTQSRPRHWSRGLELGSSAAVPQRTDQSWGGQSRGYQDQKQGPRNLPLILGGVATVFIGGLLFFSARDVTTGVTSGSDEEEGAPGATVPVVLKFPQEVQYLIVGAGTAAMSASKTIRKNNATAKVLMLTEESERPYMRPPLSKELWFQGSDPEKLIFKDWAGKEKSVFYEQEEFYLQPELLESAENGGTAIGYQKKVKRIDVAAQKAILEDGSTIKYDKCLLAPGGKPRRLPVFEKIECACAKARVHYYRNIEDFHRLHSAVSKAKSVLVVGGGFLGSELAVALAQQAKDKDLKVYQTFPEEGNMGLVFPEYLSQWTLGRVREEGVEVIPGKFITDCSYNRWAKQIEMTFNDGEKLSAEQVVVAVGLQPNIELAESSGLEVDPNHGGFHVNAELEARKNLWVAGDAACFYDINLGRRRVEHHDHAVVSGRLSGQNMLGEGKPYWHQSMFWSDLGPAVGYEAIGICDSKLATFAVFAKSSEQDTPQAVVERTGESDRSETESGIETKDMTSESDDIDVPHPPKEGEDYGKGVIFYTRNDKIVGIVLWNLFGRMPIARQILKEGKVAEDLSEVARVFDIHDQKTTKTT